VDSGAVDTDIESARVQAAVMASLGPDRRTALALDMSSALLRRRQAMLLETTGGNRAEMLRRFVAMQYGDRLAEGFAAHLRGATGGDGCERGRD
jgi:hypothetical protein